MSDVERARALLDALWGGLGPVLPPPGLLMLEELPLEDPWEPGVSELNLLARPFMERAGLDHLDVFVELWDGDEKLRGLPDQDKGRPAHQPAVWFDVVVEGLCIFAAEQAGAWETRRCVASMASSVGEAFMDQRLKGMDELIAQPAAWDVAALALGFCSAVLPAPPSLSAEAALDVMAELCRRTDLDPSQIELALAPKLHPAFVRLLTDA